VLRQESHPEQGGLGAAGTSKSRGHPVCERHKEIWKVKAAREFRSSMVEKMVEAACEHQYLAVLGCANSSKTTTFAMWALISWLAAPSETLVLVTSTSLKDSRRRIWGKITEYFTAIRGLPGKLVDSEGKIKPRTTVWCISGHQRHCDHRWRSEKGKGIHRQTDWVESQEIVMIADEMPELSPALIAAFMGNLASNRPANSSASQLQQHSGPARCHGKAQARLDSISPEDDEWERTWGIAFGSMG